MLLMGMTSLRAVPAAASDLLYRPCYSVPEAVSVQKKRPCTLTCTGALGKARYHPDSAVNTQPSVEAFDGASRRRLLLFACAAPGGVIVACMRRLSPAAGSLKRCSRDASHHRLFCDCLIIVSKGGGNVKDFWGNGIVIAMKDDL